MEKREIIKKLFKDIDRKDTVAFTGYLTEDVNFRFGNMPVVSGKKQVGESVQGFNESISALRHDIENIWQTDDVIICNGTVNYTRHDSSRLSVPFTNIFKMEGNLIGEYLIYADISELYR